MKPVRRMYDWVLSWAHTRYGTPALATLSFAESSVFPIPPDVLLIALCLGDRRKWAWFAAVCSLASLLGGLVGYLIGWGFWSVVDQWFYAYVPGFTPEAFEKVQGLYEKWDFWIVFIAAFTPIPYKVITITAGVFGINVAAFTVATIIGRSARFFLVAFLIYWFGEPITRFIDKWFNWLTLLFVALLIGGFLALRAFH